MSVAAVSADLKQNICCSAHLSFFWKVKKGYNMKDLTFLGHGRCQKGEFSGEDFRAAHSLADSVFQGFEVTETHLLLRSALYITLYQGGLMNFQLMTFQDFPDLLTALLSSFSSATYMCAFRYFSCIFRSLHFPIFIAAMLLRVMISAPSPRLLHC